MSLIINNQLESITPASGVLILGGSGALGLPNGPSASRPTNSAGLIRFNSDIGYIEFNNGSTWLTTGSGTITSIIAGTGLTGGTITATGTISIPLNGIANNLIRQSYPLTIVGNPTVGTANVQDILIGTGLTFSAGTALALGTSGVTAGTYNGASVVVDALGRVTSISAGRTRLTSTLIMYVSPTGNDSNNGLTIGAPFLTIQKAVDTLGSNYDFNGQQASIQLADGTYTAQTTISMPSVGGPVLSSHMAIEISGNVGTPSNVVVQPPATSAFVVQGRGVCVQVQHLKISTPSIDSACLLALENSHLSYQNIVFGTSGGAHIVAQFGATLYSVGINNTIVAGAKEHVILSQSAAWYQTTAVVTTLTGTPVFTKFIDISGCSVATARGTYSGSATGTRYIGQLNAVFDTNGAGTSYFPGSIAGTLLTGAQYA